MANQLVTVRSKLAHKVADKLAHKLAHKLADLSAKMVQTLPTKSLHTEQGARELAQEAYSA